MHCSKSPRKCPSTECLRVDVGVSPSFWAGDPGWLLSSVKALWSCSWAALDLPLHEQPTCHHGVVKAELQLTTPCTVPSICISPQGHAVGEHGNHTGLCCVVWPMLWHSARRATQMPHQTGRLSKGGPYERTQRLSTHADSPSLLWPRKCIAHMMAHIHWRIMRLKMHSQHEPSRPTCERAAAGS